MAPEVITSSPHTKSVDWWGLGILMHELLLGVTPFADENHLVVQRRILKMQIALPDDLDQKAASLIVSLINRDARARLGAGARGTEDVKAAPFFGSLDFDRVYACGYTPEWTPPAGGVIPTEPIADEAGNALPLLPADADDADDADADDDLFSGFDYRRDDKVSRARRATAASRARGVTFSCSTKEHDGQRYEY